MGRRHTFVLHKIHDHHILSDKSRSRIENRRIRLCTNIPSSHILHRSDTSSHIPSLRNYHSRTDVCTYTSTSPHCKYPDPSMSFRYLPRDTSSSPRNVLPRIHPYTRTSESRHHILLRFGIRRNRASSNNHSNRNSHDKNKPHLNIFHWAESNRDEHCTSCFHIPDRSDRHRIYTCVPRRSSAPCTRNRCNHRHKRAPNSPNLQIQLDIDKILSMYRKFHFHYILHHMP